MKTACPEYWPQFYTATIHQWRHLLSEDKHKSIIIDSLKFLVTEKRIILNAFVIMNNHIHLIWQPMFGFTPSDIQSSFMKYTARQLKCSLVKNDLEMLADFKVNKYDREYQIWKRESLNIELITPAVFDQKLDYIHYNPVRAGLCVNPEDYYYSSAKFYFEGTDSFDMLTHYSGN
jgi:putative transposase